MFYSYKINEDYIYFCVTQHYDMVLTINESITHKLFTVSMTMYSLNFKALL